MNKSHCLIITFLLSQFNSVGQSMKWPVRSVSGEVKVVDFSTPLPTVGATILGLGLNGNEEVNAMTDASNNILFLTASDGTNNIRIFDANNNPMPNGDNIRAGANTLESAICKISCTSDQYYLFNHTSSTSGDSLFYSVIDMSLNGGLGDVTLKNVFIASGFTEGMTLSHQKRNGCRWLLIPGIINDTLTINEIMISYYGVSNPVVIDRYPLSNAVNKKHEIELSPDNRKVCVSTYTSNPNDSDIIVFDFDLESGNLTNRKLYSVSNDPVLGIEFSPDANKVYFQSHTTFTLSKLGRINLITDSIFVIDSMRDRNLTNIELAANGKLYASGNLTNNYLSEIGDPNNPVDTNILYLKDAVLIDTLGCRPGLPNFIDGETPGTFVFPIGDDFMASYTTNCLAYYFVDSSCLATWWSWDFGDGGTSSISSPVHQFNTPGTYNVTMRVSVCADTFTVSKNVNISLINIPIGIPANSYMCNGSPVSLTALGATTYNWSPAIGLNGTTGNSVIANPSSVTTYTVTGTVPYGCTGSSNVVVTPLQVNPTIVPSGPINLCAGSSTTLTANGGTQYSWSNGATTSSIIVNAAGNYTVTASTNGCQAVNSVSVSILPPMNPIITSYPGFSFCLGDSVQLTLNGNGIASQHWQRNNYNTGQTSNSIYVYSSGSYSVIVNDVNGCVDTPSTTLTLKLSPSPNFATDSICSLTKSFQNFSNNGVQYSWYFGDGTVDNAYAPQHDFPYNGTFNVKLIAKSLQGCLDSIEKKVPVVIYSSSAFSNAYDSCTGKIHFRPASTDAQTYTWEFGDNGTSTSAYPANNYSHAGSYQATLTTNKNFNCEEKTIALVKAPEPLNDYLYIPNSFSPNGDGINDVFTIYGHSTCGNYELFIYNRWGEIVYSTNDITKFWDGKQHGQGVEGGAYCWLIKENGQSRTGMVYVYL